MKGGCPPPPPDDLNIHPGLNFEGLPFDFSSYIAMKMASVADMALNHHSLSPLPIHTNF